MIGASGRCYPNVMTRQMREARFVNVEVKEFEMPIGPWPKDKRLAEAGTFGLIGFLDGLHGLSVKIFTNVLGWTPEQLDVLLAAVKIEVVQKSFHTCWPTAGAESLELNHHCAC